jgi:nitroimidazol reductase NimA-like FMN-containing flavoprotein (pyridoxamine 5'-phosphate oxidase superfamily)
VTADLVAARRMFGGLPVVNVATIGPDGGPHVVPLWFVWPEDAVYVSTRRGSRTWRNVEREPKVGLAIDLGRSWSELTGLSIFGSAELLLAEQAGMRKAISAWHDKYRALLSGEGFARFSEEVERLGFLRVSVERVAAWDHARG